MKKLISLAIIVAFAVLLTLAAVENTGRIAIFLPSQRIDFSINFAIISLIVTLFLITVIFKIFKVSGQVPQKIRFYFEKRRQLNALKAHQEMFSAFVMSDSHLADKALEKMLKSGDCADVVRAMHALVAIQHKQYELAQKSLSLISKTKNDLSETLQVLEAQIAIAQSNPIQALELIQHLSSKTKKLTVIRRIKLDAFLSTERWEEALRIAKENQIIETLSETEYHTLLKKIYIGLFKEQNSVDAINRLVAQIIKEHCSAHGLVNDLALYLLATGWVDQAKKLIEANLTLALSNQVLLTYQKIAQAEPKSCLDFTENLVEKNSTNILLLHIAAEIYEQQQLWGKAIVTYEQLYKAQPSPSLAHQLTRLYENANKPEIAQQWKQKFQQQLSLSKMTL